MYVSFNEKGKKYKYHKRIKKHNLKLLLIKKQLLCVFKYLKIFIFKENA